MTKARCRFTVVALLGVVALLSMAGCSSDDESSPSTTGAGASSEENEEFCSEVENLVDQSAPGDLTVLGDLTAYTQAMQSLAATAPEAIVGDVQTIATVSQTKLEAVQVDPTATLPPAAADEARAANQAFATWVADNCNGLVVPTVQL